MLRLVFWDCLEGTDQVEVYNPIGPEKGRDEAYLIIYAMFADFFGNSKSRTATGHVYGQLAAGLLCRPVSI